MGRRGGDSKGAGASALKTVVGLPASEITQNGCSNGDSSPNFSTSASFHSGDPLVAEKLHFGSVDSRCPPGVCENAQVNSAILKLQHVSADRSCPPGVCDNAPAISAAFQHSIPSLGGSSLSPKAIPFTPGSVDAILNICGNSSGSRAAIPPPTNPSLARTAVSPANNAAATINSPAPVSNILKPIPKAWSRKAATFEAQPEPQESYKSNGVIDLDEEEADIIKSDFENALVGRVIGRNLRFEWLASQLQDRWGGYEGFRINDLGNGCFILFFGNRESRDDVWLGGPWHVAGYQLGLDRWTENFIPSKNPPMCVPTWIRIPVLPLHFWGEKKLRRISTEVGEPLFIDSFTKARTRTIFARVCVRRDLSKPSWAESG